jgi:formate dehydrogenase (NADP+) alpha subunit
MNSRTLIIDGDPVIAEEGQTILEAALSAGVYIPHLCFHPDLQKRLHTETVRVPHLPVAERNKNAKEVEKNISERAGVLEGERCHKCDTQCRLCLIEIEGVGLTTSCDTPVVDGLKVRTDTPQIEACRRELVSSLLENHSGDCLECFKSGSCKLQEVATYLGGFDEQRSRARAKNPRISIDDSNPFYSYDPNKCVLCGNCFYTCEEIQGVGAIDFGFREYDPQAKPIGDSRCESCGECVSRCPVGALQPKTFEKPSREVSTICSYCGVGCGILLGARGDRVVSARAKPDSPVNQGNLCVKGRFGWEFVNHPDRLTRPLVKKNGSFEEVEWDEALDLVAEKLAHSKGDAFGAFSSARTLNEDNYVFQKFVRAVMETNNIDHCARL